MPSFYCYECLNKPGWREAKSGICSRCDSELRAVSNKKRRAQVVTRLANKRGIKKPTKKSWYKEYLNSSLWKTIRERVMDRDDWKCCDCGAKAQQVHHMSYAPDVMAGEDDSKLVSLCEPCHKARHPEKRKRRKKK